MKEDILADKNELRTIKELKHFFNDEARIHLINEIFNRFENAGFEVKQVNFPNNDYKSVYLISSVPFQIDLRSGDTINSCDEKYWVNQIPDLNDAQKKMIIRDLPNVNCDTIEKAIVTIESFIERNPLFMSKKLADHNDKSGVFEGLKTFENWKDSEILRNANRATGVFEEENEKDGEEWINDCFIDSNHETAEIVAEEGKVKVGVIYDDQGSPLEDQITIELSDVPQSGYVTIHVNELRKLLQTAHAQLDNFPKVI